MGRVARGWVLMFAMIGAIAAALQILVFRPKPVAVRIVRVQRGTVEEIVTSTKAGAIRSRARADVSVDVAGTIVAIHAREGDAVRRGDHLLSIDRREANATLAAARKDLVALELLVAEAKARLLDAEREHHRLEELARDGVVTASELDQAQTQVDVCKATVAAAEARAEAHKAHVTQCETLVEKCDLHAPFDGVVAERHVELGEWAVPGKTAMQILDPNRLYVRAELDEVDIGKLCADLPIRVTLDPYRDRRLAGRISRIAPYVSEAEEQNRTVVIEVELVAGADGLALKPGTSADVEVILDAHRDVLRIPTLALLPNDRVMTVRDGRAVTLPIKIGLKNWDFAEVTAGLQEGDAVIVSLGSDALAPGVRVQVEREAER